MKKEYEAMCLVCEWSGDWEDLESAYFDMEGFEYTSEEMKNFDQECVDEFFSETMSCPSCGSNKIRPDVTFETSRNERNIHFLRKKVKLLEEQVKILIELTSGPINKKMTITQKKVMKKKTTKQKIK